GFLLLVSLCTAAAVAGAGAIGFVGLVIPHLARRLVGARHRVLVPAAALLGALFLLWPTPSHGWSCSRRSCRSVCSPPPSARPSCWCSCAACTPGPAEPRPTDLEGRPAIPPPHRPREGTAWPPSLPTTPAASADAPLWARWSGSPASPPPAATAARGPPAQAPQATPRRAGRASRSSS